MRTASHRSRFLPLMAALTATAWLTLWLWGQSPYARYLDHGKWTEIGVAGRLCRALSSGDVILSGRLGSDAGRNDATDDIASARYLSPSDRATRRPAAADRARHPRLCRGLGGFW